MPNTENPVIPEAVAKALGTLASLLSEAGYITSEVESSKSFGDFAVTFSGPRGAIQISRDRGQFIVSGPTKEQLELAGLWRAFAGARDLEQPLRVWLEAANEA